MAYFGPDQYRIWRAKSEAAAMLRDPDSAVFNDVAVNGNYVCGFVNSRNGFGAMTGRTLFIYDSLGNVEFEPREMFFDGQQMARLRRSCEDEQAAGGPYSSLGLRDDGNACREYQRAASDTLEFADWMSATIEKCPSLVELLE